MKFSYLLSSVALLAFLALYSVSSNAQGLHLGIKAGVNIDQTRGDVLNEDFSGFFLGGAFVGLHFSRVRVQAEALFSQNKITTGAGFKNAFGNYLSEKGEELKNGTFKMNELSVPVLVGFNLVPKLLWVEVGPQYTAVVSIKDVDGFVKSVGDVVKNGYVSGVVGAELGLPLRLNLGLRYVFGLSDRNNTSVPDNWRSSHFQATLGYSFF